MRKGYPALVLGLMVSACGGEEAVQAPPQAPSPPPPAAAAMASQPLPSVAAETKPKPSLMELQSTNGKAYVDAMNAHDAKKVASLYADDATLNVPGFPEKNGEFKGRAELEKLHQGFFEGFKDAKFWFSRVWVKADVAAIEWGWTGTHTGEILGAKATEKPAGVQGVSVVWYDQEGRIKKENRYSDSVVVLTQLGALKGKARALPMPATALEVFVSKGSPDEDKNVEIVKGSTAAFESRKDADFLAPLADDIEYDDASHAEVSKGKGEAKKFFGMFTKAFPDAKLTQGALFAAGDFVVSESATAATHKGPLGPLPASKKSVTMHGVELFQLKDGKIAKGWSYGNSAELLSQVGALKALGVAKLVNTTDRGDKTSAAAAPAPGAKTRGTGAKTGGTGTHSGGGGGAGTGGGTGGGANKAEPAKK